MYIISCVYHLYISYVLNLQLSSPQRFPNFDFSEIVHNEDVFYSNERETDEHCCDRAVKFLEWLNKRPEKCIAVVTHSSFLRHLFGQFGENLHKDDMDNMQRLAGNCELRSIVLCSHGNKDGKNIDPLMPPSNAPSTGKCYMHILKSLFRSFPPLLTQHLPSYAHLSYTIVRMKSMISGDLQSMMSGASEELEGEKEDEMYGQEALAPVKGS